MSNTILVAFTTEQARAITDWARRRIESNTAAAEMIRQSSLITQSNKESALRAGVEELSTVKMILDALKAALGGQDDRRLDS